MVKYLDIAKKGRDARMEAAYSPISAGRKTPKFYITAIFIAGILMYATQFFITDALLLGVVQLFGREWAQIEWLWVLAMCGMYLLTILIPGIFLLIVFRERPFAGWKLRTACPKYPFLFIPTAIGALYVLNLAINMLLGDLLAPFDTTLTADDFVKTPAAIAVYFAYSALMPALLEEWFFRGLVQKRLIPVFGDKAAILLSAFLFGMMHLEPGQSIFAFGFGLFAGYAYARTGSIWFGAMIHLLNNAISIGSGYWYLVYNSETVIWIFEIFTLVMMGVGTVGLLIYRHASKKKRISLVQEERMLPRGASVLKMTLTNPCLYLMVGCYCALLWVLYFL